MQSFATLILIASALSWHAVAFSTPFAPRRSVLLRQHVGQQRLQAAASADDESDKNYPWETPLDMAEEETLLKINLSLVDTNTVDPETALTKVQQYTQGFPFAAVLPVQPLQYLPTKDGGVDVLFMRKKTQEKGSIDGGMRFFVSTNDNNGVEVEVKRNSKGQSISKMFTEKLVVQAYCEGISGTDDAASPLADFVSVSSIFHKWL